MKPGNMPQPKGYVLITGSTSGIGYELAKCFAEDNYNLILASRTEESLQKVAEELSTEYKIIVETYAIDLMVPGASKELYDHVKQLGVHVGILVNDAGQGEYGKFVETDLDREIDLIHLNVIALVGLTKHFLKDMVQRGEGRILQVASALAKAPTPYMAVYAATKAFVYSFSEALVVELKDTGVTVTALLPGATDTDFFHKAGAENTKEYKETELYTPQEVAKAAFDGLMSGKDKVVPGFKNKMMGVMGNLMPDSMVAANLEKHMEHSDKENGRTNITHPQSAEEREQINNKTGSGDGDVDQHSGHIHESGNKQ